EVVRVGWFESAFNTTDELGRRSGYAYDYQQKIAAYTGWTYEYVNGSWPELLRMLEDGKIDLLSDVSFTDERAEHMLYAALPMGTEQYYLFAAPGNQEIDPEDYATFNGKKVGANKGSVQIGFFHDWAKANGVEAELVELTGTEEENLKNLRLGKIDLYLSLDGLIADGAAVPVCKVGVSDFYFAVSKSRSELMPELNGAMSRVQEEEPYYNQALYAKYLRTSSTNNYLNGNESAWLAKHGAIRVGYQDNYLALCAKDQQTGELTGALKDCLGVASNCLENAQLDFEPVCYPTSAAAMEALQNGEVDCVFPTNLTAYDGEMRGVFVTPAIMSTDMSAVIRESDKENFQKKDRVTVAVNADNPNYDVFLLENFPDWRAIYFADTQECLKAVAGGQADCLLISNYRYNNIARQCEEYGLTTWSTGVEMDYCLAVNREDTVLYSILAKAISGVPSSTANAALTYYFMEDTRIGIADSLRQNLLSIALGAVCVLVVAALVIVFLLLRSARAGKRGDGQEATIPTKEDFALFDDLPLSYSVYHVTHAEHSELYDAKIIYVNHRFEQLGGLPAEAVLGYSVRELYPHIGEEWFQNVSRAAIDGEKVELDYVDPLSGKTYRYMACQVMCPGYCAVTYL
ncbi:MAG: transporter substrate-binding domain-containing protein, partial [Coriobacteriales bacterium]|nr:transporter substrate-binding domain-containing protein [Coriobacteriales bacterium]